MPSLRLLFSLLACALAAGVVSAQPAPLDDILDQIRQKTGTPAIAAAAVQDGKIVALGVRGAREQGQPETVALGDQWLVGSCTKPMTRMLAAKLGAKFPQLAPTATLAQLLPDVPMRDEYKAVTLDDLLRHTAGLPAYTRITPTLTPIVFETKGTPKEQRAKFAAHVLNEAPAGPRGQMLYSNAAYALLGHILERTAGSSWEELMREEVFEPLGMKGATFGFAPGAVVPKGHRRTNNKVIVTDGGPMGTGVLAPAGAVCLPLEDFARFAMAQADQKGGEEGRIQLGGQGSYTAGISTWPSRKFGVVVCTNAGDGDSACEEVIKAVRQKFAPDLPEGGGPGGSGGPGGPRIGVVLRGEADGPGGAVRVSIDQVVPGSIAEKAGLKAGDELVSIDGQPMSEMSPGAPPPGLRKPGAKIVVKREGKEVTITMP